MTQWKLVPVEPTDEMFFSGCEVQGSEYINVNKLWAAMLNAAPHHDVQPVAWLYTYPEIEGADACTTSRVTELHPDLVETSLYTHPVADDTALLRQCLRALQDIYIAPEHLDYIADWWPACMEAIIALRDRLGEGK